MEIHWRISVTLDVPDYKQAVAQLSFMIFLDAVLKTTAPKRTVFLLCRCDEEGEVEWHRVPDYISIFLLFFPESRSHN